MSSQTLQEILCCIGYPVAGNPTQYLMEKAFLAAGLDWHFFTVEVPPDELAAALAGMRAMGFRGGVLSDPHKCQALEHVDDLTAAARRAGAVTLMQRRDNHWIGENSDGKGLLANLQALREIQGLRAVVLGTDAAAAAIGAELGLAGAAELTLAGSDATQGESLAERLAAQELKVRFVLLEDDLELGEEVELLVNAIPLGEGDEAARVPVEVETLQEQLIVADVTFVPPDTWLIREARARGCRTIDGLSMIVDQACYAFQFWTQHEADPKLLREALEEFLGV